MAKSLNINLEMQDEADLNGLFTLHSAAAGTIKLGQSSKLMESLVQQLETFIRDQVSPQAWQMYQDQLEQEYAKLAANGNMVKNEITGNPELNLKFQA